LPFLGHLQTTARGPPRRKVPIIGGERQRDRRSTGKPANDVVQLIIDYAKQETLGPLKGVGRFVAFGVIGAVALSGGALLLLLALLRALQTETGTTFKGDLSWAPYLVTGGAATVLAGLAAWRISKGPAQRRKVKAKGDD
jgi:Putative Actinobacterial Holin-X, holin superfamily III